MRVAVVHSFYGGGSPSGENIVVMDQIAQLQSAGHEVELVGRWTDDLADAAQYKALALSRTVTGWGGSPAQRLREFRPDVVHLHNSFPNWGTAWLRTWGHRTVTTLHNYRTVCAAATLTRDGHDCQACLFTPVLPAVQHACYRSSRVASLPVAVAASPVGALRKVPRRSARVVCLNEQAAALYRRLVGDKVRVIPNFVVGSDASTVPRGGWVYVGRLSPEKGVEHLLRSWPRDQRLDLIGDGPSVETVQAVVRTLPLVRYLGPMNREDVLERFGQYDGLVVPSLLHESLPTVVLEGLANGVPALLSVHMDVTTELVSRGAGVSFDPRAGQESLVTALAALIARRPEMSRTARRLHRDRYSPPAWQAAIDALYAEVTVTGQEHRPSAIR